MARHPNLEEALEALAADVDALNALLHEATAGLVLLGHTVRRGQEALKSMAPESEHDADEIPLLIGTGEPGTPEANVRHITTQGEALARSGDGGAHRIAIGNACVVYLFAAWEVRHRAAVASALRLYRVDELKVPLFGDLRLLRNSILHRGGQASKEVEHRSEILRWYSEGDDIVIDTVKWDEVRRRVWEWAVDLLVQQVDDGAAARSEGLWNRVFEPAKPLPAAALLAAHPDAERLTRGLVDAPSATRVIAIANAMYNLCRPAYLGTGPAASAEAWRILRERKDTPFSREGTKWVRLLKAMEPIPEWAAARIRGMSIEELGMVGQALIRGPYRSM